MTDSLAETAADGASRKWLADPTLGRMSIRVTTPVRVVIIALCLVGVLAAVQRTVIAVLHQPRDASGFTAIERVVVEVLASVSGIDQGTPRYDDLTAGTLAFEKKYEANRALILLHVLPGGLILLLAPFQFSDRIRRRYVAYHRWTGRVLLVAVAISGISAFIFGLFMPFGGWRESAAVMLFGTLFFYAGARAWVAIRRRDVTMHREWITRMFAVAVGIATTRVISIGVSALTTLSLREVFLVSLWAGFASSVVAGEIIIRRARLHHVPMRAPAVARNSR